MHSDVKFQNTFENPFFIGTVVDNKDPNYSYRVKVRLNILHDNIEDADLPWAAKVDSSFMGVGDTDTLHAIPEVNSKVLVLAIGNDPNSLIYLGNLYTNSKVTPQNDDYLNTYGIYTKDGDWIKVDKIKKLIELVWRGTINIDKITDMHITVNGPITVNSQEVTVTNTKSITVNTNTAIVNAKSSTNVTCPNNTIKGNVTINGTLKVSDAVTMGSTLSVSDAVTAKTVTADTEVTAGTPAIMLTKHKHSNGTAGDGNTGTPLP